MHSQLSCTISTVHRLTQYKGKQNKNKDTDMWKGSKIADRGEWRKGIECIKVELVLKCGLTHLLHCVRISCGIHCSRPSYLHCWYLRRVIKHSKQMLLTNLNSIKNLLSLVMLGKSIRDKCLSLMKSNWFHMGWSRLDFFNTTRYRLAIRWNKFHASIISVRK